MFCFPPQNLCSSLVIIICSLASARYPLHGLVRKGSRLGFTFIWFSTPLQGLGQPTVTIKQHEQLSNFRQRGLGTNSVVPILLLTLCFIMCYPFSVVFLKMPRFLCNAHRKILSIVYVRLHCMAFFRECMPFTLLFLWYASLQFLVSSSLLKSLFSYL
jgi:hypothetical protein